MTVNNLYVTYDDEGQPHFHVNDEEVSREVWMQRHPNMKEDKTNGRNQDSAGVGRVDQDSVGSDGPDAKEQQRQRIRELRDKAKAEAAQGLVDNVEDGTGT